MLILGRKVGQSIRVGDSRIVVISNNRGIIRLGIAAPKDIRVDREEVYLAKRRKEENERNLHPS